MKGSPTHMRMPWNGMDPGDTGLDSRWNSLHATDTYRYHSTHTHRQKSLLTNAKNPTLFLLTLCRPHTHTHVVHFLECHIKVIVELLQDCFYGFASQQNSLVSISCGIADSVCIQAKPLHTNSIPRTPCLHSISTSQHNEKTSWFLHFEKLISYDYL